MSLIRFNRNRLPWINDRLTHWFDTDDFFADDFFMRDRNVPAMNVKENKDNFEVELAVPGFSKKDIEVTMENDILHITVQNSLEEVDEKEYYTRKEFSCHAFDRKLQLPSSIDQTKNVEAMYKDGLLVLRIGKKEEAKELPKKIIDIA